LRGPGHRLPAPPSPGRTLVGLGIRFRVRV
jgi:hypothetical protein